MRNINLLINWFDSTVRPQEFDTCLKRNLRLFHRVVNLNGRPTFTDFFRCASKFPDDINVVANLDIYFDDTINLAQWIDQDTVYCLTRWEDTGSRVIQFKDRHNGHPGEWTQDAWIFTGNRILEVCAPFCLGERGCDNHLAWLFKQAGFNVLNPSLDIRAIHLHNIDTGASMGRGERVGDGNYLGVKPENIRM